MWLLERLQVFVLMPKIQLLEKKLERRPELEQKFNSFIKYAVIESHHI